MLEKGLFIPTEIAEGTIVQTAASCTKDYTGGDSGCTVNYNTWSGGCESTMHSHHWHAGSSLAQTWQDRTALFLRDPQAEHYELYHESHESGLHRQASCVNFFMWDHVHA